MPRSATTGASFLNTSDDHVPYLPDFLWEDIDGRMHYVEVKPERKLQRNVDGCRYKWDMLQAYCAGAGYEAHMIDEHHLALVAEEVGAWTGQVMPPPITDGLS